MPFIAHFRAPRPLERTLAECGCSANSPPAATLFQLLGRSHRSLQCFLGHCLAVGNSGLPSPPHACLSLRQKPPPHYSGSVAMVCAAVNRTAETRLPGQKALGWAGLHPGTLRPFSLCESYSGVAADQRQALSFTRLCLGMTWKLLSFCPHLPFSLMRVSLPSLE